MPYSSKIIQFYQVVSLPPSLVVHKSPSPLVLLFLVKVFVSLIVVTIYGGWVLSDPRSKGQFKKYVQSIKCIQITMTNFTTFQ